jgi:hypothetical protein
MVDLGTAGTASYAAAISSNGNTIVGVTGSGYSSLTPPTSGEVCEWTKSGSTWSACTILPSVTAPTVTGATAINSSGAVVGAVNTAGGGPPTCDGLYISSSSATSYTDLGNEGLSADNNAPQCWARAINDSGVIVGNDVAYPWVDYTDATGALTPISSSLLASGQGTGWSFSDSVVYGIDSNGDIAMQQMGYNSKTEACLLTPVPSPEPSSLLLAAGGMLGLAVYTWRKRK